MSELALLCTTISLVILSSDRVDPDSTDNYGRTPLLLAAAMEHEVVVKLLLVVDGVDPAKSTYGLAPLSLSARNENESVVRLLLAKDGVDPNFKGKALLLAAANGHDAVVDPDSQYKDGQTPLPVRRSTVTLL